MCIYNVYIQYVYIICKYSIYNMYVVLQFLSFTIIITVTIKCDGTSQYYLIIYIYP